VRRVALGALVTVAAVSTVLVAPQLRGRDEENGLERSLEALVSAGMPGALVRVRDGDETVELARGEATPGIRFRVGSLTKTFVAALTIRLADRGMLSLDDPMGRFLPGLLRDGDRVTIRDLLDHRAGLFDYTGDPELLRDDRPPRELVAIADRLERTHGYSYSSTNYLALGLVLEKATGRRLGDLLREEVFEPFGLEETSFEAGVVTGAHLHGHALASHDGIATGTARDTSRVPATSAWAAAAVVSTADDLDRFFAALETRGLIRRMAPHDDSVYGLGIARSETPCGPALGHTGNVLGTVTVVRSRGGRLAIVAGNVYPFTREVGKRFADLLRIAMCG